MAPSISGEFVLPVIGPDTANGDPWKRNYFAPPQHLDLVSRKYPLVNTRPQFETDAYNPKDLLQSHGFGIVKHNSEFLEHLDQGEVHDKALTEVYYPEIEELVLKITEAKKVFITASVLRQGKRVPTEYEPPSGIGSATEARDVNKPADEGSPPKHKLANQSKLGLAAPVRKPHMDFTPLGARQEIRSKSVEIYQAAKESGVIDWEDDICSRYDVVATTEESNFPISAKYNGNGQLGPRYAAYSIWRPLRKVERDPLALSPRRESRTAPVGGVYWPYLNRIPGPAELRGDYLKEYAMLGVRSWDHGEEDVPMKWYYISEHQSDEVLFIKLFDSAALGQESEHASAPWHASPEIGDTAGNEPRESIDVRVLVFW